MENPLKTEMRNPNTTHIDKMSTNEILRIMNAENKTVFNAVEEVLVNLAPLVDHIAKNLEKGGRLFYVGAGTSGRIGVMDAVECPPTFGIPYGQIVGIIAGGEQAMTKAVEIEEDSLEKGQESIAQYALTAYDTILGISAAGSAAFVIGALKAAKQTGATTACLCCNKDTPLEKLSDFIISPDTGPEVITGSTRLKAGTAQKIIVNMISTAVMVKTGKVYENYMINIKPANIKLQARAVQILHEISGKPKEIASSALSQAGGDIRKAAKQLSVQGREE